MAAQLERLQLVLDSKQAAVADLAGADALRASYDAALRTLAAERDGLQRERAELVQVRPQCRWVGVDCQGMGCGVGTACIAGILPKACPKRAAPTACPKRAAPTRPPARQPPPCPMPRPPHFPQKLASLRESGAEARAALEARYRGRIRELDDRVRALAKKERAARELERTKADAEAVAARLRADIVAIKGQKVALARQAEKSAKDFAEWRRQRDREVAQVRTQGCCACACPAPPRPAPPGPPTFILRERSLRSWGPPRLISGCCCGGGSLLAPRPTPLWAPPAAPPTRSCGARAGRRRRR